MKDSDAGECRSLREIELEVEAEMREWGRKRLQEKLQEQADLHGRIFPHSRRELWHGRRQPLTLRTAVGAVELQGAFAGAAGARRTAPKPTWNGTKSRPASSACSKRPA